MLNSCTKEIHGHPTPYFFQSTLLNPYDSVNLSGAFMYATYYGQGHFYTMPGIQKNGISTIMIDSQTIYYYCNYYVMTLIGVIPTTKSSPYYIDSIIHWDIIDTTTFSFSFDDSSIKPTQIKTIPDYIIKKEGVTFYTGYIHNADKLLVTINTTPPNNPNSIKSISKSFTLPADSITLSPEFLSEAYANNLYASVTVAAYRHLYYTTHGYRYLFIKETDQGGYLTLK